jgi:hypothetical protein
MADGSITQGAFNLVPQCAALASAMFHLLTTMTLEHTNHKPCEVETTINDFNLNGCLRNPAKLHR